jgi:hypothetical protein
MKRYKCPVCDKGRINPDKLDPEDARLYCLDCTASTGKLVRMTIPTVEQQKAARKAARVARAKQKREREKEREWLRQHTWPGVRELRWNRWAVKGTRNGGALPKVKGATSIGGYYAQMFRLGLPPALNDDRVPVTAGWSREGVSTLAIEARVAARERFLRRVGATDGEVERLRDVHDQVTFAAIYKRCMLSGIDWLIEDLRRDGGGTFDATGETAIRGVAERTDLSNPEEVKCLNNIITNAFELGQRTLEAEPDHEPNDEPNDDDHHDDDAREPLGGWQGG